MGEERGGKGKRLTQRWCVPSSRDATADVFGTPTYVVNGELFWGQDRLGFVERRIEELLAAE